MDKFRDWATDVAKMMFREDEKSSFRNLPKSTRLSILLQLSFIWSVIFSIYVFQYETCLLYTSPSPRDNRVSRMPSSA